MEAPSLHMHIHLVTALTSTSDYCQVASSEGGLKLVDQSIINQMGRLELAGSEINNSPPWNKQAVDAKAGGFMMVDKPQ